VAAALAVFATFFRTTVSLMGCRCGLGPWRLMSTGRRVAGLRAGSRSASARCSATTTASAGGSLFQDFGYDRAGMKTERLKWNIEQQCQEAIEDHHFRRRSSVGMDIHQALGHDRQDHAPPEAPERKHHHSIEPIAEHLLEQAANAGRPCEKASGKR